MKTLFWRQRSPPKAAGTWQCVQRAAGESWSLALEFHHPGASCMHLPFVEEGRQSPARARKCAVSQAAWCAGHDPGCCFQNALLACLWSLPLLFLEAEGRVWAAGVWRADW